AKRELTLLLKQRDDILVSKRSLSRGQVRSTIPVGNASASNEKTESIPKSEVVQNGDGTVKEEEQRLQTSLNAMQKAIELQQKKIDTIQTAQNDSEQEKRSLLNAINNFKVRSSESQRWIDLIEIQRVYWTSYLDMREAQLLEFCSLDDIQRGFTGRKKPI